MGATSFLFHASFTAAFQFLDYLGMFLLASLLLAVDLERLGRVPPERGVAIVLGGTTASAAVFWALRLGGLPVQPLVLVQGLALVAVEGRLAFAGKTRIVRFAPTLLVMLAAGAFWLADYTRLVCDPANHWFQAHAVWHVLTAGAMVTAFRFYSEAVNAG